MITAISPASASSWARGEHAYIEQYNSTDDQVRAHWVDTVPLGELLRARGVEMVHLLAVDVEGAELAILRSLDFAVVRVEVILVECNTPAVAKEVKHFLHEQELSLSPAHWRGSPFRSPAIAMVRRELSGMQLRLHSVSMPRVAL